MKLKLSAAVEPDTISWRIIFLHKHKSLSVQTGFVSNSDHNHFGAEIANIFNMHSQPAGFGVNEALVHILSLQGPSERSVRKDTLLEMALVVWYSRCHSAHQEGTTATGSRDVSSTHSYSV